MKLVENVHYEEVVTHQQRGQYLDAGFYYEYWNKDGEQRHLRVTHPDVDIDDLIKLGNHLHDVKKACCGSKINPRRL